MVVRGLLNDKPRRTLLAVRPMPAPRISTPGEPLYGLESDGSRYRCELRDSGEFGVEAQIFMNGELWQACRFTVRALAVRWAEQMRDRSSFAEK